MALERYRVDVSWVDAFHQEFLRNVRRRRRFAITLNTGSHIFGVPSANSREVVATEATTFRVVSRTAMYEVPYGDVAFAEELCDEVALRSSDGRPLPPEPCSPPDNRKKHEKFRILDSPSLVDTDLPSAIGVFGAALLYLDIDKFKQYNTSHTETAVDRDLLPRFQALVDEAVQGHGYAYAEGGDEVIVVLKNANLAIARTFAEELRVKIRSQPFEVAGTPVHLTVSIGVASSERDTGNLRTDANLAKQRAKDEGRDRVVVAEP